MPSTSLSSSNPYHEVKNKIWPERYLSLVRARWNWQIIALGLLILVGILVGALVWQSSKSMVVPYIVRVDQLGQSLVIGPAQASQIADPKVVSWQLQSFIRDIRQVTADKTAQKSLLDRAYLRASGAAVGFLNDYFRGEETNPFNRNRQEIVTPAIRNTLQHGEKTWQVEWVETKYSLAGKSIGEETWIGQFEVETIPPTTAEAIVANPLGFYVTRVSWSRKF